ncbi:MAG: hypothetical protein KQJ78_22500 [Deltaproteobacteria bacterium]|nr:hypothetical protein [Deltaproteobacteria bacterium]
MQPQARSWVRVFLLVMTWVLLVAPAALAQQNVTAGRDYFTAEYGNPLDYSDAADWRYGGRFDEGMVGASVSGGKLNYTTALAGNRFFYLLYPGMVNTVPMEESGEFLPIKADAFRVFAMRLGCSNCPASGVYGLLWWFNGGTGGQYYAWGPFFPTFQPSTIYVMDMSTMTAQVTGTLGSALFTGDMWGLALGPDNSGGHNLSVDWVTLTIPGGSNVSLNYGGYGGSVTLRLYDDLGGALSSQVLVYRYDPANPFASAGPLATSAAAASLAQVDVSWLPPGTYWIRAFQGINSSVNEILTARTQFTVNHPPSLTITQPDARGDEARDYATVNRGGDAWDFTQLTDYNAALSPGSTITNPTNPATTTAGVLSGTWLKLRNLNGDPMLVLSQPGAISAATYHHLTVRMLLDSYLAYNNYGPGRIYWGTSEWATSTGQDFLILNGVYEYHFDLNNMPVDESTPTAATWPATGSVNYFRIDPHELTYAVDTYFDYVLLTPSDSTSAGSFNITFTTSDADAQSVRVTLYLDPDRDRTNGNEFQLTASPLAAGTTSYNLIPGDHPGLTAGTYYVAGSASDGINTSWAYSTGPLVVTSGGPVVPGGPVPMYRCYNANLWYHFFTIRASEFHNAVAAGYNDESTGYADRLFYVEPSPTGSAVAVHRLYNPYSGRHYYTYKDAERNTLVALGWNYERDEGAIYPTAGVAPAGTTEVFRLYNTVTGTHLYTTSAPEVSYILNTQPQWQKHTSLGWAYTWAGAGYPAI